MHTCKVAESEMQLTSQVKDLPAFKEKNIKNILYYEVESKNGE